MSKEEMDDHEYDQVKVPDEEDWACKKLVNLI